MKKEIAFISAMVVLGIALSLLLVYVLGALQVPSDIEFPGDNYSFFTIQEKANLEIMSQKFGLVLKHTYVLVAVPLLIIVITFILFFIILNKNFNNKLTDKTKRLKSITVALLCGACFLLLFIFSSTASFVLVLNTSDISVLTTLTPIILTVTPWFTSEHATSDIFVYLLSFGFIWLIAGEIGWAGDFSLWKLNPNSKKSKPLLAFILGVGAGASACGLLYLNKWVFTKYVFLVSEVLDKSSETSWLGFKLLAYGLVFMSSFSFAILAGVIITLVPQHITVKQRALKAIFPLILFMAFMSIISVKYNEAVTKYDLGKKSFAEAIGIPEKTSEIKTLVFLGPDAEIIQKVSMETEISHFSKNIPYTLNRLIISDRFAVSYENLEKIEAYLKKRENNSVYYYAAIEGLINGYNRLLDAKKGLEFQAKGSEHFLMYRIILLSRFGKLPVTKKNIDYLKSFADENKWQIDKKFALEICRAFHHFGMKKEAVFWANKAKEKGIVGLAITFFNENTLTNGIIKGRIRINGKTPANIKVALFVYSKHIENIFEEPTFPNRLNILIDSVNTNKFGRFTFKNLGRGNYVLAIMTDDKTIPHTTPAEKIKADNSPGLIMLDDSKPIADIRDINLVVSK